MKKYLKTAIILFILCAVLSTALAVINFITKPVIEENTRLNLIASLNEVAVGGEVDMDKGEIMINKGAVVSGYNVNMPGSDMRFASILKLKVKGYGGEFFIIASYDIDGYLGSVKLLENSETPGIGKKFEKRENAELFCKYEVVPTRKTQLNKEDVPITSGATVTFQGLANALAEGQKYIRENMGGLK